MFHSITGKARNLPGNFSLVQLRLRLLTYHTLQADGDDSQYDVIIRNIIGHYIENSRLTVQLAEKKYQSQRLELLALRNQINPHFLFNTLDSISWKAIGSTGISSPLVIMLQDLASLLKYSFAGPSHATLQDEVDSIRSYLHIQRIRYVGKFSYEEEIDSRVLDAQVPRLFLQPLVENAIYHGVKLLEGEGLITMRVCEDTPGLFLISIADNGPGIDAETLEKLLDTLSLRQDMSTLDTGDSIGLVNTLRRLDLFYGEGSCRLTIESRPYEQTVVTLRLPYNRTVGPQNAVMVE